MNKGIPVSKPQYLKAKPYSLIKGIKQLHPGGVYEVVAMSFDDRKAYLICDDGNVRLYRIDKFWPCTRDGKEIETYVPAPKKIYGEHEKGFRYSE